MDPMGIYLYSYTVSYTPDFFQEKISSYLTTGLVAATSCGLLHQLGLPNFGCFLAEAVNKKSYLVLKTP